MTVAVVTDSTPYLPPHLIERWGIREVALYVGWGGELRPEYEYSDLDIFCPESWHETPPSPQRDALWDREQDG